MVFVDKLAEDLKLLLETTVILKKERCSLEFLSAITQQDLERVFQIDAKDALRLRFWCQSKAREEEDEEAKGKAREDKDEEAKRKAREAKLKSVSIYNSLQGTWMDHDFVRQSDLSFLLDRWQSAGLVAIEAAATSDADESRSSSLPETRRAVVVTLVGNLVSGTHYYHVGLRHAGLPKSIVDELQDKLAKADRAKAD